LIFLILIQQVRVVGEVAAYGRLRGKFFVNELLARVIKE
jgi:hypothetical protein